MKIKILDQLNGVFLYGVIAVSIVSLYVKYVEPSLISTKTIILLGGPGAIFLIGYVITGYAVLKAPASDSGLKPLDGKSPVSKEVSTLPPARKERFVAKYPVASLQEPNNDSTQEPAFHHNLVIPEQHITHSENLMTVNEPKKSMQDSMKSIIPSVFTPKPDSMKFKLPNVDEPPVSINYRPADKTYRANYNGKNIMALDVNAIKSALTQEVMHKVTSNWSPMIIIKRDTVNASLNIDVKFIGMITETGKDDQYVISDVTIPDSNDVSTWIPSLNYKPWENDGSCKLIPFTIKRLEMLQAIESKLATMKQRVHDVIFRDDAVDFVDAVVQDKQVFLDVIGDI